MTLLSAILTDVVLAIILVLLAIRTVLDALWLFDLAPAFVRRRVDERRRREYRELMGQHGFDEQASWARGTAQSRAIRRELTDDNTSLVGRLDAITARYVDEGPFVVGSASKQPMQYFANLRRAFCAYPDGQDLDHQLGAIMVAYVRNQTLEHSLSYDLVVGRRSGLDALAYLVANAVGKPLLLCTENGGVRRGNDDASPLLAMDYAPKPGMRAIIVDDSCVGGGDFRAMAHNLKKARVRVEHVLVLFCRAEGQAVKNLAADKLTLHALTSYDDAQLQALSASVAE